MKLEEVKTQLQKFIRGYNIMYGTRLQYKQVFSSNTPSYFTKKNKKYFVDNWKREDKPGDVYLVNPEYHNSKIDGIVPGKTIHIAGESDNTIPYPLFDIIEDRFCAYRVHLG